MIVEIDGILWMKLSKSSNKQNIITHLLTFIISKIDKFVISKNTRNIQQIF